MELIFVTLVHTFPVSACALVCSRECRSCFDDFVSNRMARAPLLHHGGGVAHQTSLLSRSIMMCYANFPPWGGGYPIQLPRSLLAQDHCCNQAFPNGLPPSAATFHVG